MTEYPQYTSNEELDSLVSIPSFLCKTFTTGLLLLFPLSPSPPLPPRFSLSAPSFFVYLFQIRQEKPYYLPNPELDSLVSIINTLIQRDSPKSSHSFQFPFAFRFLGSVFIFLLRVSAVPSCAAIIKMCRDAGNTSQPLSDKMPTAVAVAGQGV